MGTVMSKIYAHCQPLPLWRRACAGLMCRCIPEEGCLDKVKSLMKLAVPLIISQMLLFLINLVSTMFCGHLGKEELDAVTIANNVMSVLGFSFGVGFSAAADTLLSQTFGGKNLKQIGVILQQSLLMLILICFPCWAIFVNTEKLLLLIRQDPKVSRLADDYVLISIPVLLEAFVYQLQASFLQNQGITVPQLFIGIAVNIINAILHYAFLFVLDFGVMGAALAVNIARISQIIMTFIYIWIKKLHVETWGGWSWECLQNWGPLTSLAVPSFLTVFFEWWIYEIGTLLAGLVSVTELGAQAVLYQVVVFLYMIPYGMGTAVGVRVGNELGAGNAQEAKSSSTVALLSTGILIAFDVTVVGASRMVIARLFTSDEGIIALTARTLLIYSVFHIFESFGCVTNGILKGMGKQKIGAVAYAIGYYAIGLPVALALMFPAKLGVLGLWSGMTVSAFIPAFFLTMYILRANWKNIEVEAQERAGLKQKTPSVQVPSYTDSISWEESSQNGFDFPAYDQNGQLLDQLPLANQSAPMDPTKKDIVPKRMLILRRGLIFMAAVVILIVGILVRVLSL
ncbi:multidrug and toxin extrusion protein 2-like isoform X2 [Pleurodeles waltl]|uniref:multidrug and toxin extrusion protein 2-like isoform X2 n=1 Tax=Pleurodeles waltl TaxID=8319 RepID=UPI0037096FF9